MNENKNVNNLMQFNLNKKLPIKHVLAVLSGKGGVGKTTIAVQLALCLKEKGLRVGILDIDIHGPNVPIILGIENEDLKVKDNKVIPVMFDSIAIVSTHFAAKDKAIIWRGPLKHKLIMDYLNIVDWPELDFLIVDFPPGTGDETLSFAQLIKNKVDDVRAIIVSMANDLSIKDASRAVDFCRKLNLDILGLVENMSSDIFGKGLVEEFCKANDLKFLGRVELSKEIAKMNQEKRPQCVLHDIVESILKIY